MRGATGPGRPGGCTSRRRTGGYDRSASPHWRTRSSNGPSSRCSTRSTRADFRGFSYGFRPGRGPHDALDALTIGLERKKVNWVLDADIRDFFGQLDRAWLRRFLEHRIADPRVLRLVDKWLAAGVVEGSGRRPSGVQRREHRYRRCSPTCTCTTSSTCGSIGGDTTRRAATSLSCVSRTTSPSGFTIVTTPTGSSPRFATGSPSSVWSCTRTRRG